MTNQTCCCRCHWLQLRQGFLLKKSTKSLNKDWKKVGPTLSRCPCHLSPSPLPSPEQKYCTLTAGVLTYHPSLRDYMNNSHGKEVPLRHTTVKIPGASKFRLLSATATGAPANDCSTDTDGAAASSKKHGKGGKHKRNKSAAAETAPAPSAGEQTGSTDPTADPCGAGTHFTIVSLDSTEWRFEAESASERADWVAAIEEQILCSLQGLRSERQMKEQSSGGTPATAATDSAVPAAAAAAECCPLADEESLSAIRRVAGNDCCADCRAPSESLCHSLTVVSHSPPPVSCVRQQTRCGVA